MKMVVEVEGFPKPEITWYLDGLPVRNDIHHRVVEDGGVIGLDILSCSATFLIHFYCLRGPSFSISCGL